MGMLGDLFGVGDAKKAADAQRQGFEDSIQTYRNYGDQAANYLNPYFQTGQTATGNINAALGGDYSAFQRSPGYQFAVEEGEKGVGNYLSRIGMTKSGRGIKDMERFRQGLANQEYGNWFNRQIGAASQGLSAGNQLAGLNQWQGGNIAGAQQGSAAARGSGYMANANFKNYLASSMHESGQRIGEAWATMGMGGGMGG